MGERGFKTTAEGVTPVTAQATRTIGTGKSGERRNTCHRRGTRSRHYREGGNPVNAGFRI